MNRQPQFTQAALDYERIEEAIYYLEDNFRQQPTLDEIADSVHLSKYHFQRLFKRWAGVTPAQFMHYLTVSYAKEQLDAAQSVFETALAAGLSGSGRLHDLFVSFEAMTPGEYKNKGANLQVIYGVHPTPFGMCLLGMTERGICALRFVTTEQLPAVAEVLQTDWPLATLVRDEGQTAVYIDQIFNQTHPEKPFHLLLKGTNFQVQVWQALVQIPNGRLVTYSDVAVNIGRPQATRAVASAVANNPIGYLIPCHRVISKAGKLHQYRWGTARKKALVGWEAAHVQQLVE